MLLIIGLGNPGQKHTNTRHNIGFKTIDEFARENNFPEFKFSKKFNSLLSENAFDNEKIHNLKIILAKPQTFMNESGKAVKKITTNYKLQTLKESAEAYPTGQATNLIVVHDDIDLPLGKIKIVSNRGSAGHKGVESIISELGSKDFIRIRIGIRADKENQMEEPERFVVQKFRKEEENILRKTRKKAVEIIKSIIVEGLEKTMNKYNV